MEKVEGKSKQKKSKSVVLDVDRPARFNLDWCDSVRLNGATHVRVGLCCRDVKARSKPMNNLMDRLTAYGDIEVVYFGDDVLANKPVEKWPKCDCVIAFFSTGFPLDKAEAYARLYPDMMVLNDLPSQHLLFSRVEVMKLLDKLDIPHPEQVVVWREPDRGEEAASVFEEQLDAIVVDGVRLEKPFVEKPISGEDHNIYVYYHSSQGGGSRHLFRKVGDKSSSFNPEGHHVRTDKSYVYERFITCAKYQRDIKVYTIGMDYAHAESREAPTTGRSVRRTAGGREQRYAVQLLPEEVEYASKIVAGTGQMICGIDVLRAENGVSYVCDVNGWSSVKSKSDYAQRCGRFLRFRFLNFVLERQLRTDRLSRARQGRPDALEVSFKAPPAGSTSGTKRGSFSARSPGRSPRELRPNTPDALQTDSGADVSGNESASGRGLFSHRLAGSGGGSRGHLRSRSSANQRRMRFSSTPATGLTFRGQVAVFRHADRTPKQKIKIRMAARSLCELFGARKSPTDFRQIKWKGSVHEDEIAGLMTRVEEMLGVGASAPSRRAGALDAGQYSPHERHDGGWTVQGVEQQDVPKLRVVYSTLQRGCEGLKIQLKPTSAEPVSPSGGEDNGFRVTTLLMVCKWGGMITITGEKQAMIMGRWFRAKLIPVSSDAEIADFLKGVRIYANTERRVVATATKFASAFSHSGASETDFVGDDDPYLAPDEADRHDVDFGGAGGGSEEMGSSPEDGTPIGPHTSLTLGMEVEGLPVLSNDDTVAMLGDSSAAKQLMEDMKKTIMIRAHSHENDMEFNGNTYEALMRAQLPANRDWKGNNNTFRETLLYLYELVSALCKEVDELRNNDSPIEFYNGETLLSVHRRWTFLHKCLYNPKTDEFDTSKVPDVLDYASYDALHNTTSFKVLMSLYSTSKIVSNLVIMKEYGLQPIQRLQIGQLMCSPLIEHIITNVKKIQRGSRTAAFYFTSESHIHSLLNLLCYSSPANILPFETYFVNYLSYITIDVYEDLELPEDDPNHWYIDVLFSPGVHRSTFSAKTTDDISPVYPPHNLTFKALNMGDLMNMCT